VACRIGADVVTQHVAFTSLCPKCKREQRQDGYTRSALLELLSTGRAIEVRCATCNEVWSISDRERTGIAKRV